MTRKKTVDPDPDIEGEPGEEFVEETDPETPVVEEVPAPFVEEVPAPAESPLTHVLVCFGGTVDAVPVPMPADAYKNLEGLCRERRLTINGVNVEHVSEQAHELGDWWVYREM